MATLPEPILIGLARFRTPSLSVSGYGTISLALQARDTVPYPEKLPMLISSHYSVRSVTRMDIIITGTVLNITRTDLYFG